MLTAIIAAVTALLGVILGGGVRAWEARRSRAADADALLSGLVAEVEAVTRLIDHRQFIPGLQACREKAQQQVQAGHGGEDAEFMVIELSQNYFSVFDASVSKLGLLNPYHADRIVRFYTYTKAVQENYRKASPFQDGVTASEVVEIIDNDLVLLQTIIGLGIHIALFRPAVAPKGTIDPFATNQPVIEQPSLPTAPAAASDLS